MTAQDDAPSELIEIRKYPNRRYYDASRSRHLTLEGIRQLIRKGANVKIVDSQTGGDITSRTLTQMILEFDAPKLELFTAPLLTEMIRVNDQVMKGFFEKFFHQALAAFFAFQSQLERQLRAGRILPSLFPSFAPWPTHAVPPAPSAPAAEPPSDGGDLAEAVRQLQAQVAALTKKSRKPSARKPRAPMSERK